MKIEPKKRAMLLMWGKLLAQGQDLSGRGVFCLPVFNDNILLSLKA